MLRQKSTEVGVTRRWGHQVGGEWSTNGCGGGTRGTVGRHDVLEASEVGAVGPEGVAVGPWADDTGLRLNLELASGLGGVDELD